MEDDGMDERFKKVLTDPRFKRLPTRKKKIQIDSRFTGMFDKGFNGEPLIDKRGRKVKNTKNDGLKRFYEVKDDDDKPGVSDISRKLRGEDNDEDSSSSDESSSEEEIEEGEGEETEAPDLVESEVPRTDEITTRFAVTNVDWDRLKAVDLFVLLNSFKPNEGDIVSVKIYPSEFGKERMEKEKLEGPKELTEVKLDEEEEDPYESTIQDADEIINTDVPFVSEKLRRYQINRLKYFYAVVECDKPETAAALYDQLDGMEYESSASTLDLRFIPDGMTFDDDEPDSVCFEMPSLIDYNPPHFITTALQQTKVCLTWDETDPNRAKTLSKAFTERDRISDDLACYLASSSSEEDEGEVASEEDDCISLEGKSVQDRISKYKDLLKTVEEEAGEEDGKDIDMEVKWEPEIENIGKKIIEKKAKESMTVFEKQMAERKAKKRGKKESKVENDSGSDEDEDEKSGDNNQDYESDNRSDEIEQSDDNNESTDCDNEGVDEDELALLVMDDEKKDKKHFNYEDLVENKKSRRRKKRKDKSKQEEDNFEFNEDDPRFKAIYESHLYNIDQSSSHFKKTQAYDKILKRKASKDPDQRYKRSK